MGGLVAAAVWLELSTTSNLTGSETVCGDWVDGGADEVVSGTDNGGEFKGVSILVERRSATGGFSGSGPD